MCPKTLHAFNRAERGLGRVDFWTLIKVAEKLRQPCKSLILRAMCEVSSGNLPQSKQPISDFRAFFLGTASASKSRMKMTPTQNPVTKIWSVCAWCYPGTSVYAFHPHLKNQTISHGCCRECADGLMAQARAAFARTYAPKTNGSQH